MVRKKDISRRQKYDAHFPSFRSGKYRVKDVAVWHEVRVEDTKKGNIAGSLRYGKASGPTRGLTSITSAKSVNEANKIVRLLNRGKKKLGKKYNQ